MKKFLLFLVLALAGLPTIAAAQEGGRDPALAEAETRGQLIYNYDQAAWHTTDEMRRKIKNPAAAGIKGWVVEPDGNGLLVTYYGLEGDTPFAIFKAGAKGQTVLSSHVVTAGEDRTLSSAALQMIKTRAAALAQDYTSCAKASSNTVVLPPEADGTTFVYILTPQLRTGEYPAGGHNLFKVDAAGKVLASRVFMKTCMMLEAPEHAVAVGLTHLLDPHPTEIHVFLSLWMEKTLFVIAGNRTWKVEGARISGLDTKAAQ